MDIKEALARRCEGFQMNEFKLVPMEPTEAMIDAAREIHEGERYLPTILYTDIYKAMLTAAPAVQGEPVAVMYEDGSVLSKADCGDNFEFCCKVLTPLYAAPQPAPDVSALVEAAQRVLDGLNARIDSAAMHGGTTPVFDGIANLHDALAAHRKGGES